MILALANQKGGCGKTTTAASLAQAAAHKGKRCLAIDMDPQCNLTFVLDADGARPGTFEMLEGQPARDLIQHTSTGIDVIPASWNLQTITSTKGSARRLQAALEPIKGEYDYIICDTGPAAGELQYNALMAADRLLIPITADIFTLQGLYMIADTARQIQKSNTGLQIIGYILTRYNNRSTVNRQLAEAIQARAQEMQIPFLLGIREAIAVREAQALKQNLFKYAPNSKPAQDYLQLFEIIDGGNKEP